MDCYHLLYLFIFEVYLQHVSELWTFYARGIEPSSAKFTPKLLYQALSRFSVLQAKESWARALGTRPLLAYDSAVYCGTWE